MAAGSFFRLKEIDAADAAAHPSCWDDLRAGRLDGILIHNVYDAETLARTVARLERHDPPFLKTSFPAPFRSWFYGRNLNLAEPGLPGYFGEAALFHRQLDALAETGFDLVPRVTEILSALDRGRPFVAAAGPDAGQRYMFTTIRAHEEGGHIPAHCDNEVALRPSYAHLAEHVEPHLYSYVLALTRAEDGGALQVFDYRLPARGRSLMSDDGARTGDERPDPSTLDRISFRLAPGSMIILDSGRYLHRVTPVEGSTKRWTVCSFLARRRAGDATWCWG